MVKYSICMTCYNEVSTAKDSLNSILAQLDDNFEVVVVDNFSKDGTYEVLREFGKSNGVKVIQKHCSRGLGRQVAFENSSGEYIIANLDLDDFFLPVLRKIVAEYHQKVEGDLLAVFNSYPSPDAAFGWVQNMTIGPRKLITSLEGWRDVQLFEDLDIWIRASRIHKYRWTAARFATNVSLHPELNRAHSRLAYRYRRYLDRLRLGRRVFAPGEKVTLSQRLVYVAARVSLPFEGVLLGQDQEFNSYDRTRFVDFSLGERPGARQVGFRPTA